MKEYDLRGLYNQVVLLCDAGHYEQAQQVCQVADALPVPDHIKGGVQLAAQAAYDALEGHND